MKQLQECLEGRHGNYIFPFFWQHGEDDATLIREIDAIYQSGIRALCVESRTHEQFCEDGWWHTMDVIIDACRTRDMKVWLLDDKHFPSGYANGIIPKKYPEQHMWGITERHMDVTGPQKDASVLCFPKVAADAVLIGAVLCERAPGSSEILTGKTIDLTDHIADGMLYFDIPAGCHRVMFLYKTASGIGSNYAQYADKLTAFGGDAFIEAVYEPHYAHYKEEFGKTFAGFFSDEPCFGNNSANPFRAALGRKYSHFPYSEEMLSMLNDALDGQAIAMLPSLWMDTTDETAARTRLAYMDIITKLYSKNFTYKLGDWCRAHGVEYIGHIIEDDEQHTGTHDSAGHYFRALDGQDMSGIDVVLDQIIPGFTDNSNTVPCNYDLAYPELFHFTLPKLAPSHAHIQPEKKGRAMCEIYGAYGWAEGLKMMKWLTDLMLVRGINQFVPHAFTPPFPDPDCPPHMYANGQNPQFKKFRMLMDYMNRVCHITNGGIHISDAALLYHAEARWVNGDAPGAHMRVDIPARFLTEHQLDYDIVPADRLEGAAVVDSKLHLADEVYPCLIIPQAKVLPRRILESLSALAAQGLMLYFIDGIPVPAEGGIPVGFNGNVQTVPHVDDLEKFLHKNGATDVTVTGESRFLRIYHYVHGGTHYYMMTNEGIYADIDVTVQLSAFAGGTYAIYDAMDNRAVLEQSASGSIPVQLPPYESRIFITGELPEDLPFAKHTQKVASRPLCAVWDISTAEEADYPNFTSYRHTSELYNITGKDALPRFSGHMRYETAFDAQKPSADMRLVLDLGDVGESATVWVNGQKIGDRITPPYRFDITDAVNSGSNRLTVEVTNHLGYRLRDYFSQFLQFAPSGLLGPVMLETRQISAESK